MSKLNHEQQRQYYQRRASSLERKLKSLQTLYERFQGETRSTDETLLETEVIDRGYKVTIGNVSGELSHCKKEISKLNIIINNDTKNKA